MKVKKIALTGGIGSGKSAALEILSEAGYAVFSCDEISKNITDKKETAAAIQALFPSTKLLNGAVLDRKALANEVFSDSAKLALLNVYLHPLIIKTAFERADACGKEIAFIEVPLLLEGGYEKLFDRVMVITRAFSDRIESVKKRSNLTESEILSRIKSQTNYKQRDLTPYCVIENDGNLIELKEKVLVAAKNLVKS